MTSAAVVTRAGDIPADPPARLVATAVHHWPNARAVAVSADGRLVAAAVAEAARPGAWSDAGRIVLWETATGRLIRTIDTRGDVIQLRISADGRSLLYGVVRTLGDAVDDDATFLLSLDGPAQGGRFPGTGVFALAPSGSALFLSDHASLCRRLEIPLRPGAEAAAMAGAAALAEALACSPDGGSFAAVYRTLQPVPVGAGGVTRTLMRLRGLAVCDSVSLRPKCVAETDAVADCSSLDLASDGRWVATGHHDGAVRLWDGAGLTSAGTIDGAGSAPALVTFSPDGSELAVLSQPVAWQGTAPAANARCELSFHRVPGLETLRRFAFEDGGVASTHPRRERSAFNPRRLAYVPDGTAVCLGVGGVTLVETASGAVVRSFDGAAASSVDGR